MQTMNIPEILAKLETPGPGYIVESWSWDQDTCAAVLAEYRVGRVTPGQFKHPAFFETLLVHLRDAEQARRILQECACGPTRLYPFVLDGGALQISCWSIETSHSPGYNFSLREILEMVASRRYKIIFPGSANFSEWIDKAKALAGFFGPFGAHPKHVAPRLEAHHD